MYISIYRVLYHSHFVTIINYHERRRTKTGTCKPLPFVRKRLPLSRSSSVVFLTPYRQCYKTYLRIIEILIKNFSNFPFISTIFASLISHRKP